MAKDTRGQLLNTAETLFAERGFYGVSIAAVADDLGLTKQALLHHFGSKEKLYGAVLQRISDDLQRQLSSAVAQRSDPAAQLKTYLLLLAEDAMERPVRTQLLMRELLDNKRRAASASTWYLKTYLETLTDLLHAAPAWISAPRPTAFSAVYQLLGAINYFAVSKPTLEGIFGKSSCEDIDDQFPIQLGASIDAVIANRI